MPPTHTHTPWVLRFHDFSPLGLIRDLEFQDYLTTFKNVNYAPISKRFSFVSPLYFLTKISCTLIAHISSRKSHANMYIIYQRNHITYNIHLSNNQLFITFYSYSQSLKLHNQGVSSAFTYFVIIHVHIALNDKIKYLKLKHHTS